MSIVPVPEMDHSPSITIFANGRKMNSDDELNKVSVEQPPDVMNLMDADAEIAGLELADIIDAPAIQSLMDDFYKLARIPMSIVDLKGKLLVGVGWQEICTDFHRQHPDSLQNCIESDLDRKSGV